MAKLEIIGSSQSEKDPKKESVHIIVNEDIGNLRYYALLDNSYKDGAVSNIHLHIYIFPSAQAKKGDKIIVSTGKHDNYHKETADKKNKIYYYFTQSDAPWWNNEGDVATIIVFNVVHSMKLKRLP
jgi:hypothetical protein